MQIKYGLYKYILGRCSCGRCIDYRYFWAVFSEPEDFNDNDYDKSLEYVILKLEEGFCPTCGCVLHSSGIAIDIESEKYIDIDIPEIILCRFKTCA